jgi:multidrug efflux pump subunit AcrA (membrane-fusion protein)
MNHVKIGQKIKKGDVLAIIQHHANQENLVTLMAEEMSHETYKIKREKLVKLPELIQEVRCDWY